MRKDVLKSCVWDIYYKVLNSSLSFKYLDYNLLKKKNRPDTEGTEFGQDFPLTTIQCFLSKCRFHLEAIFEMLSVNSNMGTSESENTP